MKRVATAADKIVNWTSGLIGIGAAAGLGAYVKHPLHRQVPLWVCLLGVLAVVGVAAALVHRERRLRAAGEAGAANSLHTLKWHAPDDMSAFQAALAEARERVVLIGISHAGFYNPNEQKLRAFLGSSALARLDVFVLDPGCDNLVERAAHEAVGGGIGPDVMASDIRSFAARLLALDPRKVSVKTYDWYPTWRIQMIDQDVIFAASYPAGARGLSQKLVEVRRAGHPELFEMLHNVVRSYERETGHVAAWS